MPSLRQQIREYFDAHALPPGKVDAILAGGREPAAVEDAGKVVAFPNWPRRLALAAVFLIFAGLAIWMLPPQPAAVPFAALPPRVVEFFAAGPHLPLISQDQTALRQWLLAQGAPAEFAVPAKLQSLESYACSVVDVSGRPAYLTCFWRKKNDDGTGGELIHLLAVKRADFRDEPTGRQPQMRQIGDWSFASWSEGEVAYTLAAVAPPEKLREFVTAPLGSSRRLLVAVSF